MEKKINVYGVLVQKPEGKKQLGRLRRKLEYIITDIKHKGSEGVNCTHPTEKRNKRRSLVNTAMYLLVPQNAGNFWTTWALCVWLYTKCLCCIQFAVIIHTQPPLYSQTCAIAQRRYVRKYPKSNEDKHTALPLWFLTRRNKSDVYRQSCLHRSFVSFWHVEFSSRRLEASLLYTDSDTRLVDETKQISRPCYLKPRAGPLISNIFFASQKQMTYCYYFLSFLHKMEKQTSSMCPKSHFPRSQVPRKHCFIYESVLRRWYMCIRHDFCRSTLTSCWWSVVHKALFPWIWSIISVKQHFRHSASLKSLNCQRPSTIKTYLDSCPRLRVPALSATSFSTS